MTKRKLILEREAAAMVRMSVTNFRRWSIEVGIFPIDLSAPSSKKRSLRYYEDEIEAVIIAATEKRDKEQAYIRSVLRFERKASL
jgi:hypothetical protein